MIRSRRAFVAEAAVLTAAGGTLLGSCATATDQKPNEDDATRVRFEVYPIGKVEKIEGATRIRLFDEYADGLLGLDEWSHVNVLYWFDRNDTPQQRRVLQVHPRGDRQNPFTGVFACRAPVRPNLIALSVCEVMAIEKNVVTIYEIDAFDGTPVIDLKPFIPPDAPNQNIRVPNWTGRQRPRD